MSDAAQRLVGTWTLERYALTLADGETVEPLGASPQGRLVYTAGGFMSAHLAPGDGSAATLGYCGRWRLEGERVLHDVEISSRPGMAGAVAARGMALDGDRLVLTAEGAREAPREGARTGTGVLTWRRLDGGGDG